MMITLSEKRSGFLLGKSVLASAVIRIRAGRNLGEGYAPAAGVPAPSAGAAAVFIALDTRAGVRAVDSRLIEMAQSFGATERQIWRKILVRGGMPGIVAGLRIGLSRALAGMVTAELLMVAAGIGGLSLEFRGDFRADGVFAVVLVVVLESLVVMQLSRWMERRLVPWSPGPVEMIPAQPTATAVQHRTAVS